MQQNLINTQLGETDIYLIDQILKGRYRNTDKLLDAGCGNGRNLQWFIYSNICIYGIDSNESAILQLQKEHTHFPANRFRIEKVEQLSFSDGYFEHIICSAVLHFAQNEHHFFSMMNELLRVLKRGGSLFIRTASDIGLEGKVLPLGNGQYGLPDGTTRFLLTRNLLETIKGLPVLFLEEVKTLNVADTRCMTTLVLQKSL